MRRPAHRSEVDVLAVIAVGGALGSLARWATEQFADARLVDVAAGRVFPWPTLGINILGCVLIGVLMVVVTEAARPTRYVRPFLGVGVLGGFTTFSTFAVGTRTLAATGHAEVAASYAAASVIGGLAAVFVGVSATRALVGARQRREGR